MDNRCACGATRKKVLDYLQALLLRRCPKNAALNSCVPLGDPKAPVHWFGFSGGNGRFCVSTTGGVTRFWSVVLVGAVCVSHGIGVGRHVEAARNNQIFWCSAHSRCLSQTHRGTSCGASSGLHLASRTHGVRNDHCTTGTHCETGAALGNLRAFARQTTEHGCGVWSGYGPGRAMHHPTHRLTGRFTGRSHVLCQLVGVSDGRAPAE